MARLRKRNSSPLDISAGGVPLCPLTFSQLREDKCFIIQRCLLPRQIQGWLWVLTTLTSQVALAVTPNPPHSSLSRSGMSSVVQGTVSEALPGVNYKSPRAGMADSHGVPINLPTRRFRLRQRRIYGGGRTQDNATPSGPPAGSLFPRSALLS